MRSKCYFLLAVIFLVFKAAKTFSDEADSGFSLENADTPTEKWEARLTNTQGSVTLFPADGSASIAAAVGMPLSDGDCIVTGKNSRAEVTLSGLHVVSILADSDFTLESTQQSKTIFGISLGTLLAKIHHLADGESLEVKTPDAVAAVRGTEFGVNAGNGMGQTHVGVFDEGAVAVQGDSGPMQLLKPNEETSVLRGQGPAPAHSLETFVQARPQMRALRQRQQLMHQRWRPLTPAQRQNLRTRLIRKQRLRNNRSLKGKARNSRRNRRSREKPRDRKKDGR